MRGESLLYHIGAGGQHLRPAADDFRDVLRWASLAEMADPQIRFNFNGASAPVGKDDDVLAFGDQPPTSRRRLLTRTLKSW